MGTFARGMCRLAALEVASSSGSAFANPAGKVRKKLAYERGAKFVDWLQIHLKAGNGGHGCVHFLQTRRGSGGPDGGDGGHGGSIKFISFGNLRDLSHLKQNYTAGNGESGSRGRSQGKNGQDLILQVPVGSILRNAENHQTLFDFMEASQEVFVVRGGRGGYGNMAFKSSVNQAPVNASPGQSGQEMFIEVELKCIADVGLVGFPNAGKSSLLRALSRAKPMVAAYPFTTLKPHIGVVEFADQSQIAACGEQATKSCCMLLVSYVADIPGLVKDAHQNKGLGHAFLRHVERCKSLLYVMDITQPNLLEQFHILKSELEFYKAGLSRLPSALVLNKIDIMADSRDAVVSKLNSINLPLFFVSAKEMLNLSLLKEALRGIVQ